MTAPSTITAPAREGKRQPKKKPGTLVLQPAAAADVAPPAPAPTTIAAPASEPDPTADTREVHISRLSLFSLNVEHREPDDDLVASVGEIGVIQRIIVRPLPDAQRDPSILPGVELFEIVCGERRYKASIASGRATVPVEVRILTDAEAFDLASAENLQREDLSAMQESTLCATHLEKFKRDIPTIAARMNKSPRWVAQRLLLQQLPQAGKTALHERRLLLGVALEVAAQPRREDREEALKLCLRPAGVAPMQVGEAREALSRFHLVMSSARFDTTDPGLVPAAGACSACPKRTGTQTVLSIEGIDDVDRCLDPACWGSKVDAAWKATAAAATAQGLAVLDMKAGGREAEAAHLLVAHPRKKNLINLDAVCDIAGDALVAPAQAKLEAARESGDAGEIEAAEQALTSAETEAEKLTWRSVIGKWCPAVALVREVHGGREKIVEFGSEQIALEALRVENFTLPPEDAAKLEAIPVEVEEVNTDEALAAPPPRKPAAWQVEARVAELLVEHVVEAVVPAAERARPWAGPTLWGALIHVMSRSVTNEEIRAICEGRKWTPARSQGQTMRDVFDARAGKLPDAGLRGLLVELVARSGADAAKRLAEVFGLDVKKMTSAARKSAQATLTTADAGAGT